MSDDLMLVTEVRARQALRGQRIRLQVLAPYGAWIGRGALRVLRLKMNGDDYADVTVGYESYESLAKREVQR